MVCTTYVYRKCIYTSLWMTSWSHHPTGTPSSVTQDGIESLLSFWFNFERLIRHIWVVVMLGFRLGGCVIAHIKKVVQFQNRTLPCHAPTSAATFDLWSHSTLWTFCEATAVAELYSGFEHHRYLSVRVLRWLVNRQNRQKGWIIAWEYSYRSWTWSWATH